jgi:hypothetical protein
MDCQLAWLAGLFEGEGYLGLSHEGRPQIQLGMTDEDVVNRACKIAGVGYVKVRPRLTKGGKQMWYWTVGRCEEAAQIIELMLPFLGERRSKRAKEVLHSWHTNPLPKRLRTHCKRGHLLAGDNIYIDTSRGFHVRVCKKCAVIRTQAYRDRHPDRVSECNRRSKLKFNNVFTISGADSN